MRWMYGLWIVVWLGMPGISGAQVYKSYDEQGHVIYSDQPPTEHAEPLELPNIQIIDYKEVSPLSVPGAGTSTARQSYTQFSIQSPQPEQSFKDVSAVAVNLQLEPKLAIDHQIVFNVTANGETVPISPTRQTQIAVMTQARGEYTVQAQLVNGDHDVIKSTPTVTFYVQRYSGIVSPANPAPTAPQAPTAPGL